MIASFHSVQIARAGGGGSSSGGSSGSSHSSSRSSYSSHTSSYSSSGGSGSGSAAASSIVFIMTGLFFFAVFILSAKMMRRLDRKPSGSSFFREFSWRSTNRPSSLSPIPASPESERILVRVKEVFLSFQDAWSTFDLKTLPTILTPILFQKMALELGVLKQQGRRNEMSQVKVKNIRLFHPADAKAATTTIIAEIRAEAKDRLIEEETKTVLNDDRSMFMEYWEFVEEKGVWKLNAIRQATEAAEQLDTRIQAFAKQEGFFYDPDFGWLMLPNKGVLFGRAQFSNSDINNHVIGEFRKAIVEFYSFIPASGKEFVVAQATLPVSYRGILVERRGGFFSRRPKGLREVVLESRAFQKEMVVWADPADQVASFELLSPNFMERISKLPFTFHLEVVGNFLYVYSEDTKKVEYKDLLEILGWAFTEMKM